MKVTSRRLFMIQMGIAFDERAIGETIFLSREEAEETLKGGTK